MALFRRNKDTQAATPESAQSWAPPTPYTLTLPRTLNVVGLFAHREHLNLVHERHGGQHGWGSVKLTAQLVPEPTNPYDSNAIAVAADGGVCGHLSKADAVEFRQWVRQAIKSQRIASVAAELVGVDDLVVMALEPARATPMDLVSIARCIEVIYDGGEIFETEKDAASLDVRISQTKAGWKIGTVYWDDSEAKWLAKQLRKHGYSTSARDSDGAWAVTVTRYDPPTPAT